MLEYNLAKNLELGNLVGDFVSSAIPSMFPVGLSRGLLFAYGTYDSSNRLPRPRFFVEDASPRFLTIFDALL